MRSSGESLLNSLAEWQLVSPVDGWTIALRATAAQRGMDNPMDRGGRANRRPPTALTTGIAHTHAALPTPPTGPREQQDLPIGLIFSYM